MTVYWKLWNTTFHANERCVIRVEYETRPMQMPAGDYNSKTHGSLPSDVLEALRRNCTVAWAEYFLDTGKQWKGVLDRCRISFELVGLSGAHIKDFYPKDGTAADNGVVWDYTEYEPSGRIVLEYCPSMPIQQIPPFMCSVVEQFPNDPELASDIGRDLSSKFLRSDLQQEIYHSFLARWDEPIPRLMEYAPGGKCRFYYRAENHFYTVWRMALILFEAYGKTGQLERGKDIAPTVSRISGAIVDSLDTCDLPEQDAWLLRKAKELLHTSNALIERQ